MFEPFLPSNCLHHLHLGQLDFCPISTAFANAELYLVVIQGKALHKSQFYIERNNVLFDHILILDKDGWVQV